MKKEKIVGLVTTHFAINYGAILQAYALHTTIKKLGYTCEVINYSPNDRLYGNKNNYNFSSLKSIVSSILLFLNVKYRDDIEKKKSRFSTFLNDFFTLSKDKYQTYEDIKKHIAQYDILICGSDQIWNLNLLNNPIFFLEFNDVLPNAKYIAYAPSISEKLSDIQYHDILRRTSHFSAIALREKNDANILNDMSDKKIIDVLDPIFLINQHEWKDVSIDIDISTPYILCYEVASDANFTKVLKILRKKLQYKLVCINTKPYNKHNADILLTDVSPQQFVGLIKNANFVLTSSFHATAFSVMFEKQFYTVSSKHRASRHRNLLIQLDLQSRIITDLEKFQKEKNIEKINYTIINDKLKKLKQKSINYLTQSLEGKYDYNS